MLICATVYVFNTTDFFGIFSNTDGNWGVKSTLESDENAGKQHALFNPYYEQKITWNKCDKFITSDITRASIDDINQFKCAYISAPLNWNGDKTDALAPDYSVKDNSFDSDSQATIKLAVITKINNKTNSKYLFTNPGGPGGSGVQEILGGSHGFSDTLADNLNFASWDPRGVGLSNPVKCYKNDEDAIIDIYKNIPGEMPDNIDAMNDDAKTFINNCKEISGSIIKYVDTISTARDMDLLRYVLSKDLLTNIGGGNSSKATNNADDIDYKLNYMGYSYGTKVGEAYATIFPNEIDHMVLDGIVNPNNSINDSALEQTRGFQKVYEAYVAACLNEQITGSTCPFANKDAKYVDDWFIASQKVLHDKPKAIASDSKREFNDNVFMTGVIMPLYSKSSWTYLNMALSMLKTKGDNSVLTLLADMYNDYEGGKLTNNPQESYFSIACSDTNEEFNIDEWTKKHDEAMQISPVFGDFIFSTEGIYCNLLPTASLPTNLVSNFDADGSDNVGKLLNTHSNANILLLSNTNDPATPLSNANNVLKMLPNAKLLTREGDEHCAYPSADNKFKDSVDQYFIKSIMPPVAKDSDNSDTDNSNNDNQSNGED